MKYKDFENLIQAIVDQLEVDYKFSKMVGEIFDNSFIGAYPNIVIDKLIKLISKSVGDDSGWIDWWIYEKECGNRDELKAYSGDADDNNELPSTTIKDLWNLIKGK